ncbi:BRO family protein [Laspinema olomoucense]|uniref:BRO family protein n=1 Tax=Laspinema olomoucense D3b TaxID=2953688 RepID=A0ABT2N4P3_9CYAN|nr:BRO family protein [Laspinema sp. D3b]MCT7977659.1 BRO family protein [Laspinema sp. D3b]
MTNLSIFNFHNNQVRIVIIDGKPWFVAKDLCEVLEIKNSRDALTRLDDDEKDTVGITDAIGREQDTTIVSESGMYTLVFSSRKPQTKPFRKWLTSKLSSMRQSADLINFTADNPQYADNSGFIYLAKTPNGWCKIGMSKQPYKRMSSLQTGTPLEVTLVHRVFTFDMVALETSLHEYYSAYWMRGEWFELPDDCIHEFPAVANELDTKLEQIYLPE